MRDWMGVPMLRVQFQEEMPISILTPIILVSFCGQNVGLNELECNICSIKYDYEKSIACS